MSEEKWALIRRRIYLSIPFVQLILATTTVAIADETWHAIIGLAGVWLLSPVSGLFAAKHVDVELARENDAMMSAYVSRETSFGTHAHEAMETLADDFNGEQLTPPTPTPLPCNEAHGTADRHTPTCEGWRDAHN